MCTDHRFDSHGFIQHFSFVPFRPHQGDTWNPVTCGTLWLGHVSAHGWPKPQHVDQSPLATCQHQKIPNVKIWNAMCWLQEPPLVEQRTFQVSHVEDSMCHFDPLTVDFLPVWPKLQIVITFSYRLRFLICLCHRKYCDEHFAMVYISWTF